jgi:hypothetical protein
MTLLTVIVAIGFVGCWFLLRRIANLLTACHQGLCELNSTADDVNNTVSATSVAIDNIEQRLDEQFPTNEPSDPLL